MLGTASRALLATLLALAALLLTPGVAAAEVSLTVDAGYQGRFLPGRPLPVSVTVSADRLVKGTLEVRGSFSGFPSGGTVSIPVEVPGGSVKRFVVVVRFPSAVDQGGVTAVLRAGGESATGEANVTYSADDELVGLLPGVMPASLPGPSALVVDAGTARFAELDDSVLAAAPGSLAPLGTIVAGPDDIRGLAPQAQRGLLAWVEDGGRLLVDSSPGTKIAGLPDAWQPGDSTRVAAGGGEVRLTGGAAVAGEWSTILEPTPTLTTNDKMNNGTGFFAPTTLGDSVAHDTGLEVAELGWLLGFLIVYVIVVGPIVYFVLRKMKRPDAAWLVVPALALVFTGVSYSAGSGLRAGTRAAHGSVVITGAAGAVERSWVGFVSRNGGDARVTLPAGWLVTDLDTSFTGGTTTNVQVAVRGDAVDGRLSLDAGQFGVLASSGAAAMDGALAVSATSTSDDSVSGTVRNDTDFSLTGVAVFVGHQTARVGQLRPGEQAEWTITRGGNNDPFIAPESTAWPNETGFNGAVDFSSTVTLPLWQEEVQRAGSDYHTTGVAVAVGFTTDFAPPAQANGDAVSDGRTAIVGRAAVAGGSDGWGAWAVRRDALRGSSFKGRPIAGDNGVPLAPGLFRFVLPAAAGAAEALHFAVPAMLGRVEVWTNGSWQVVDENLAAVGQNGFVGDMSTTHDVAVPAGAVHDGVVYARVAFRMDFGPMSGDYFELRAGPA